MTATQQDSHPRPVHGAGSSGGAARLGASDADPGAVAERFRRARRQGHPSWLWPEIPVAEWRMALVELERITAAVLRGESRVRGPSPMIGTEALGLAAYTSGLGPWLGRQVADGVLEVDAPLAALFTAHLEHARRRSERMTAELYRVVAALSGAGVQATLLKGVHTAAVCFAEPALRPMADVDVLVDQGALALAEQVLADTGYAEEVSARLTRPYRSEWRQIGAPVLPQSLWFVHGDDPFAVDLHGTLDIDFFGVRTVPFGQPPADALRASPYAGMQATVLRQPFLAAHLAVHASHGLHGLTLIRLVELVLVLRAGMRAPADWQELQELLRSLHAERFAFPAIALADALAPGLVPGALLGRLRGAAPPRLRAVIDELRPATAQRIDALALDERFMWAATPAEHLRRVGNMLLPTGVHGPIRRLTRIYAERAFRMMRGRVSLRGSRNG